MNDGVLLFVNYAVYAWLLLLPLAAIEAWELKRALNLSAGRAAAVSSLAKLASTLLASAAVFAAGWLLGLLDFIATTGTGEGDLAALAALVPCFFVSVWIEALVAAPLLKNVARDALHDALVQANLFCYAMLAIVPLVRFAKSAIVNGHLIW